MDNPIEMETGDHPIMYPSEANTNPNNDMPNFGNPFDQTNRIQTAAPDYDGPFLPHYLDWSAIPAAFLDFTHRKNASPGARHYDLGHIWFEVGNYKGAEHVPNHMISYSQDQHYVYVNKQFQDNTYLRLPVGKNGPPSYQALEERASQEIETDHSLQIVNIHTPRMQNPPMSSEPYHRRLLHLAVNESERPRARKQQKRKIKVNKPRKVQKCKIEKKGAAKTKSRKAPQTKMSTHKDTARMHRLTRRINENKYAGCQKLPYKVSKTKSRKLRV